MTLPTARVIENSISRDGVRLTSVQITAHRFILAEINTHRALSRNYRSSRAVPVAKLIQEVRENPATPVRWMKNKPGMQATEPMTEAEAEAADTIWRDEADRATQGAELLAACGVHKQWANRGLEPYLMVHGIITATEWENFYGLRVGPEAQPEFDVLAGAMLEAMRDSEPKFLKFGEWHTPYIDNEDIDHITEFCKRGSVDILLDDHITEFVRSVSAARCARVSYKVFDADRKPTTIEDIGLANRLMSEGHWSPFEHQATPDELPWVYPEQHGNFVGWRQSRKMYRNENRRFEIYPAQVNQISANVCGK